MTDLATDTLFRTLELPQGRFTVLAELNPDGRNFLAILPQAEAQGFLDAIQEGLIPNVIPQVVEERGDELHPVPREEADAAILAWVRTEMTD